MHERLYTASVSIYHDAKQEEVLEQTTSILRALSLPFGVYQNRENCKNVQLSLPIELLDVMGLSYEGDKFSNIPVIESDCVANVNFALGLLNSDGYHLAHSNGRGREELRFCTTVPNIATAFTDCLRANAIGFSGPYLWEHRNAKWRPRIEIHIARAKQVKSFVGKISFVLKPAKPVK